MLKLKSMTRINVHLLHIQLLRLSKQYVLFQTDKGWNKRQQKWSETFKNSGLFSLNSGMMQQLVDMPWIKS